MDLSLREDIYLDRIRAIEKLHDFLSDHRDEIVDILTDAASYPAAEAEVSAAIRALRGAASEIERYQPRVIERMAVFMPSNILLYSYVLYLVIPSLYVRRIDFRPSSYVTDQLARLHELLAPVHGLPVQIQRVSQRMFVDDSVRPANVVVFTGTYANAEKLKQQLRADQLYVFFGQGVNPFIVAQGAQLDAAVHDLITVRLFNTGQDCMGPDAIFVHDTLFDPFVDRLRTRLAQLRFGSRKDPLAGYSPVYYPSTFELLSDYFIENAPFVAQGGVIDYILRKIEPTVLLGTLENKAEVVEYFGPVFNVVRYGDDDALMRELSKDFYRDRAMGASLYGDISLETFLRANHTVSLNATLFDVEDGNSPFGGYGSMANYVRYQGKLKIEPVLISKAVADLIRE